MTAEVGVVGHWSEWRPHPSGAAYTLGVEEEVMLLHPEVWSLAQQIDRVMDALSEGLSSHVTPETHKSALELATGVHEGAAAIHDELAAHRRALSAELELLGLRAASAGTHPFAVWQETVVSPGQRQQAVYGSMRELARREPTFALHVHVGVTDPERAICIADRLRVHLPLLLALSANSPFWQGRDTGLASARTPLFQAFPRVGIPRAFHSYAEYVSVVDLLIRCDAFPEPTFLWWDVRPQPALGTVEVRIMDAQSGVRETAALAALVQCLARLEGEEGFAPEAAIEAPEILDENRFLGARDGVEGELVDPVEERRVPVPELVGRVLDAAGPHAQDLGCEAELEEVERLLARPGKARQLEASRGPARLPGLVRGLADEFAAG